MKKIIRLIFIALYAAFSIWVLLGVVQLCGLFIGPALKNVCCIIYLLICFSANAWLGAYHIFFMRVRKTVLEEEQWLHPLMHELNLRTSLSPEPQLLILEEPRMDAFASGDSTIVLSRGLLITLSELEIKAVLAHEYGHLKNRDTFAGAAFSLAVKPLALLHRLTERIFGPFRKPRPTPKRMQVRLFPLLFIGAACYFLPEIALVVFSLFIFMKLFPKFYSIVRVVWCYFCRSYEFQQDQFAQSLGCGKHLKSALLKLDSLDSGSMVSGYKLFQQPHPMLYARIRRLEWLEGLRPSP